MLALWQGGPDVWKRKLVSGGAIHGTVWADGSWLVQWLAAAYRGNQPNALTASIAADTIMAAIEENREK